MVTSGGEGPTGAGTLRAYLALQLGSVGASGDLPSALHHETARSVPQQEVGCPMLKGAPGSSCS
jgi:hypothetical protein